MKDFFVYIVRCSDGSFYTGHTDDLEKRLSEHNLRHYDCYTSRRLPLVLVYHATFWSRDEAINVERQIKNWGHVKKQALIDNNWDLLKILSKNTKLRSSIPRDARFTRSSGRTD